MVKADAVAPAVVAARLSSPDSEDIGGRDYGRGPGTPGGSIGVVGGDEGAGAVSRPVGADLLAVRLPVGPLVG